MIRFGASIKKKKKKNPLSCSVELIIEESWGVTVDD